MDLGNFIVIGCMSKEKATALTGGGSFLKRLFHTFERDI